MVVRREPTPVGPITDFFDRLHELHLDAGEPGVRQIATGLGRGVLSYTTVHSVLRGPRVPKWGNVELIIEHLGGDVGTFHTLWRAARRAELDGIPVAPPESADPNPSSAGSRFDFVMVNYRSQIRHEIGGRNTVHEALDNMVGSRRGTWVGWSDGTDLRHHDNPIRSVSLSIEEFEGFSSGYSNSTLWPLYHGAIERPQFRGDWRMAYHLGDYSGGQAGIAGSQGWRSASMVSASMNRMPCLTAVAR